MKRLIRALVPAVLVAAPAAAQEGGIPPPVAARLGIPVDKVKKVQDLAFEANDKLIGLEADLRRAQLALEREMRGEAPNEANVEKLIDAVGKAEVAVRKNRIGLMIRVRKALGNELWQKLEALRAEEGPHRGPGMGPPGEGMGPMSPGMGPHGPGPFGPRGPGMGPPPQPPGPPPAP